MEKDWLFKVDNNICDIRAVGVLIKDGKILVQRDCAGKEYALPGGHVRIGETLEDAIDFSGFSEIPDRGEFVSHKDNCNVVIGWMPIEKIQNLIIYPEFIKKEIYHLNEPMKHFVSKY